MAKPIKRWCFEINIVRNMSPDAKILQSFSLQNALAQNISVKLLVRPLMHRNNYMNQKIISNNPNLIRNCILSLYILRFLFPYCSFIELWRQKRAITWIFFLELYLHQRELSSKRHVSTGVILPLFNVQWKTKIEWLSICVSCWKTPYGNTRCVARILFRTTYNFLN